MMSAFGVRLLSTLALGAALTAPAAAAPYSLTFTGSVTSSAVAGVNIGDVLSLVVIVDNGGSSALSQTWSTADTVSATLSVGSYFAQFVDNFFPGGGFTTDATGALLIADWFGTDESATSTDNAGGASTARLFSNGLRTSAGLFALYSPTSGTESAWTAPTAVSSVPVSSAASLALAGLALLGATSRRRLNARAA